MLLRKLLRVILIPHLHGCRRAHIAIGCDRLANGSGCGSAVVHIRKLRTVSARYVLILYLRVHRRSVCLMAGLELSGPGTYLQSSRSAIEADAYFAAVALHHGAVVHVVCD